MTTRKRKIVLYTFDCTGCGYCVKVCGNEVLKLVDNGACRFVNVADASRCNGCGRCERRCPNGAISLKQPDIMKEKLKTAGFCLGGTALLALGVAVTMWLWNALIPEIVGWTSINYWQALGLLLLFFAVWFFLRGVVGFADLIIRKGRDWCYEHGEVDA